MSCRYTPQVCDDANSSAGVQSGRSADFGAAQRAEMPRQNNPEPSVSLEAINTSAESCDDYCDDGNDSTIDLCSPSGCVNTPLPIGSGNAYCVEIPSPVPPEIQNEIAKENTTINETQSIIDRSSTILQSVNNSTALSSEALMARRPQSCDDHDPCTVDTLNGKRCEHKPKDCDDGDPNTFDYCYNGVCYSTTTSCDDGKPCTIDSYNGSACVNTLKNCDDGNPCTVDYCDPVLGCRHSPVVCGQEKTCINGVCRYPYYPYYYDTLYYPYVAPTSAVPTVPPIQSYTIPAGTAITLPWSRSVTALGVLKVENGIAYTSGSPLRFVRLLGLEDQAVAGFQTGLPISEKADMIGLSWKDAGFTLTLIQPNGIALPVQGDNLNVMHLVGSNYDYYFLRSAAMGNWGIEVRPVNPVANGVGYSLITGLVKGAAPINLP